MAAFAERIRSAAQGLSAEEERRLKIYLGEARHSLRLVAPHLDSSQRILEVGCGAGILASFLSEEGYDITGIEPSSTGFDFMDRLSAIISAEGVTKSGFKPLRLDIAKASAASLGAFDLIISFHVLEHVDDLDGAFAAMAELLKPEGEMVHLCPNYAFPYEPHFKIPVIFFAPAVSKSFFQRKIEQKPAVWDSLNFITAARVDALAKKNGLACEFEKGVMTAFMRRLDTDEEFSKRHKGLTAQLAKTFSGGPVRTFIDSLPPGLTTPMVFRLSKGAH